MNHPERRRRRSQKVLEALSYQLTELKEQEDLQAFLLADRDGFLVAAAPSSLDLEVLSALCPMISRGELSPEELSLALDQQKASTTLLALQVQDEDLYLFCVGSSEEHTSRAGQRAEAGVHRIFKLFEERPSAEAINC